MKTSDIFICINVIQGKYRTVIVYLTASIYIHWCNSGKWRHDV